MKRGVTNICVFVDMGEVLLIYGWDQHGFIQEARSQRNQP